MTISIHTPDTNHASALSSIDIGNAVRQARQEIGYSLEDLAVTCGLTEAEITSIENGETADSGKVKRIASALKLPVSTFLPT